MTKKMVRVETKTLISVTTGIATPSGFLIFVGENNAMSPENKSEMIKDIASSIFCVAMIFTLVSLILLGIRSVFV